MKKLIALFIFLLLKTYYISSSSADDAHIQYMDDCDAKIDAFLDFIHFEALLYCIKQSLLLLFFYTMLKKGFSFKNSFQASLGSLLYAPILYGGFYVFITARSFKIRADHPITDWSAFLLFLLIVCLGFYAAWKSLSKKISYEKIADPGIVTIPGSSLFYYAYQGFWISIILRIYIIARFFPNMKVIGIYPMMLLAFFLAGMFWARFFYAYKQYKSSKIQT